jgi:molecular chaperone GrpE
MTIADDPKLPGAPAANRGADDDQDCPPDETAEQTIARLQRELTDESAEIERLRDLHLRERAELENFKKRLQRDHADALRYASTQLARDLADVIDNLERAVEHADAGGNGQSLVDGVRLVLRSAMDVLAKHGIIRIEAAGEPFDPTRHEAIASVAHPEHEPNRVVQQFQPGYTLHDRVIRPAKVSVSTKPPVETPPSDD